jgi:hypothetical protein
MAHCGDRGNQKISNDRFCFSSLAIMICFRHFLFVIHLSGQMSVEEQCHVAQGLFGYGDVLRLKNMSHALIRD